jgi:hypothetical protein
MEDSEAYSLEDPHDQQRPKRGDPEVGNGGNYKEEATGDHKVFFRDF